MAVTLVQLGVGNVGRALIREALSLRYGPRFSAILDSGGGVLREEGLAEGTLKEILMAKEKGKGLASLPDGLGREEALARVREILRTERGVLVDVTAAEGTVELLLEALEHGWGAVLANKKPLVGPWEDYRRLTGSGRLRYEATVGAGLPVIATLETLLASGDEVQRIQGLLSGTLGYIISRAEEGAPFSVAVREAQELGYTEPHPAEDLSGMDVARKALILARTLGLPLELEDVAVEPLCPQEMGELPVEEFLEELHRLDGEFRARCKGARRKRKKLRYVAEVSPQGCAVGLAEVEGEGPLGAVRGPENIFVFWSRRYRKHPLVIGGPGAGPVPTAAGVLADIVRLAER